MFIFGGKDDDNNKLNDTWKFNFKSAAWTQIVGNPEEQPTERSGHSAQVYKDQFMIIYGGIHFVTRELNDMHVLDMKKEKWVCLLEELNSPADAQAYKVPLEEGSSAIVLCASDGLFDALFPIEILQLVHDGLRSGEDAQALSARLSDTALELSRDAQRLSPAFLALAQQDLVARSREAQDDVTVVIGVIGEP